MAIVTATEGHRVRRALRDRRWLPAQPAPKVMVGAAVQPRALGRLSVKAILIAPGWCRVGQRQDEVGGGPVVDRGRCSRPWSGRRDRIDHHALTGDRVGHVGRAGDVGPALVNAAGLPRAAGVGQARPVGHPAMVMVHEAVPLAIVTPLKATVSGVPCVTVELPAQPAPKVMVGAGRGPAQGTGQDSVKAIPDCAGLVPLLVSVKMRLVVAPSLIVDALQALVRSAPPCSPPRTDRSRRWSRWSCR